MSIDPAFTVKGLISSISKRDLTPRQRDYLYTSWFGDKVLKLCQVLYKERAYVGVGMVETVLTKHHRALVKESFASLKALQRTVSVLDPCQNKRVSRLVNDLVSAKEEKVLSIIRKDSPLEMGHLLADPKMDSRGKRALLDLAMESEAFFSVRAILESNGVFFGGDVGDLLCIAAENSRWKIFEQIFYGVFSHKNRHSEAFYRVLDRLIQMPLDNQGQRAAQLIVDYVLKCPSLKPFPDVVQRKAVLLREQIPSPQKNKHR